MVLERKLTRVVPLLLAAAGFGLCWSEPVAAQGDATRPGEASAATPAGRVCGSRPQCERVLAEAAMNGPTFATAQAWMDLARLDPEGGESYRRNVGRAFATLKRVLAQDRASRSVDPVGRDADLFVRRLLPIFQAVADVEAEGRLAVGATSADPELIASLLDVGETARRAQIDLVLADSCEPLQVSLKPADLLDGETIIYSVVGQRRTYLLVGRRPGEAGASADGWTVVSGGADSGAESLSIVANGLIDHLPEKARLYANDKRENDWGIEHAQGLYARLLKPLQQRFLPPEEIASGEPAATLIFFPDPILRNVPWALLHEGRHPGLNEPDFLVRRAAIAVGPGLAYVRPTPWPKHRGGLLLGGLDEPVLRGFVSTVKNEADIRPHVAAALFGSTASASQDGRQPDRAGDQPAAVPFTRERLETKLAQGGFSVVLLATHASYASGASYILVHPAGSDEREEMQVSDIEDSLRKGRRRANPLDLLVFLACDGAVDKAGDLGLAGAALRGGASSTIGALTEVQPGPAQSYFDNSLDPKQDFLSRYYDAKRSPAQALRDVQLYYLGVAPDPKLGIVGDPASDTVQAYPANWGVFVVIGSWR